MRIFCKQRAIVHNFDASTGQGRGGLYDNHLRLKLKKVILKRWCHLQRQNKAHCSNDHLHRFYVKQNVKCQMSMSNLIFLVT